MEWIKCKKELQKLSRINFIGKLEEKTNMIDHALVLITFSIYNYIRPET